MKISRACPGMLSSENDDFKFFKTAQKHKMHVHHMHHTRDVFYVRRKVDSMKMVKVNAYIMHIFGEIELLSIHATLNYFKMHYFYDF